MYPGRPPGRRCSFLLCPGRPIFGGIMDFLDVILDTLKDAAKMLPFLLGAYLLIEYFEHRSTVKLHAVLDRFGPLGGAVLGVIPQCGFSAATANLYSRGLVTVGTLLAVFISTSDEALPVMLAHPDRMKDTLFLLAVKTVLALIVGFVVDLLLHRPVVVRKLGEEQSPEGHDCQQHGAGCSCHRGHQHSIWRSAISHTLQIFVFILLFMLAFNLLISLVGTAFIEKLLLQNSLWQPVLAAVIGFIPNCAASVLLTELYLAGSITFGSVISGLTTGAGVGLVMLFRYNKDLRQNGKIVLTLFAVGSLSGILLQLLVG